MIQWLVQHRSNHPDITAGHPPAGLLSESEKAHFATLQTPKRRQEWLLGRWTAKHLVQAMIHERQRQIIDLRDFSILRGKDGAPEVHIDGYPAVSLSISHSGDYAFCAAIMRHEWPIGADIEHIEPRSNRFITDYFTLNEIAAFRRAEKNERDTLINATWSAKESALKALHLGLKVDTRSIICQLTRLDIGGSTWAPITIQPDVQRLPVEPPRLIGWWRTMDDYVLTLVLEKYRA